jgi:hypothetical protein
VRKQRDEHVEDRRRLVGEHQQAARALVGVGQRERLAQKVLDRHLSLLERRQLEAHQHLARAQHGIDAVLALQIAQLLQIVGELVDQLQRADAVDQIADHLRFGARARARQRNLEHVLRVLRVLLARRKQHVVGVAVLEAALERHVVLQQRREHALHAAAHAVLVEAAQLAQRRGRRDGDGARLLVKLRHGVAIVLDLRRDRRRRVLEVAAAARRRASGASPTRGRPAGGRASRRAARQTRTLANRCDPSTSSSASTMPRTLSAS